jgi:hypothetical protein
MAGRLPIGSFCLLDCHYHGLMILQMPAESPEYDILEFGLDAF